MNETNRNSRNILKGVLECVWKSIQCPCFEFAQKSFYLRPKFFNGIQIRTIRWKIDERHYFSRMIMSNVRFDELELMLMAMFEQPTIKDTIQVLMEVQPLVAEDAETAALVQQTIQKMQQLNEQQFKGLELEWHRPEDDAGK